jgi:pilus assembly protein CpaB
MITLTAPMRRAMVLVFALAMGGLAAGLIHQDRLRQRRVVEAKLRELEQARQELLIQYPPPIEVLVASKDIGSGVTLTEALVRKGELPEKFTQPYAARHPKDVMGQVTLAPIAEGEQILLNKLRRADQLPQEATLSGRIEEGRRAVTTTVDILTGVGGFVRPGDTVDVLWTLKIPQEGQVVTFTLFQDVPVLAVSLERGSTDPKQKGEGSAQGGQGGQYPVTLALTPQETALLLFAREQGLLQLSLRSRQDRGEQVAVAPANMQTLMQAVLGPAAAAPQEPQSPQGPRTVEVFKGLTRSVVELKEPQMTRDR